MPFFAVAVTAREDAKDAAVPAGRRLAPVAMSLSGSSDPTSAGSWAARNDGVILEAAGDVFLAGHQVAFLVGDEAAFLVGDGATFQVGDEAATAKAVASEQSTWPPCAAAATRAARCTSALAYSPATGVAQPVCSPIRTRGVASRLGHAYAASARWAATHAATAPDASPNATKNESPSVKSSTPPKLLSAVRSTARWAPRTAP